LIAKEGPCGTVIHASERKVDLEWGVVTVWQ
jgi:hypothetical protein